MGIGVLPFLFPGPTEVFAFVCGRPVKFCALHIRLTCLLFLLSTLMMFYSIRNSHVHSIVQQLVFVSLSYPMNQILLISLPRNFVWGIKPWVTRESVVFNWCWGWLASLQLQPSLVLHDTRRSRDAPVMGLDTERLHTHLAIKELRSQQLIYNCFWLGSPYGTVKARDKGKSKKRCCSNWCCYSWSDLLFFKEHFKAAMKTKQINN